MCACAYACACVCAFDVYRTCIRVQDNITWIIKWPVCLRNRTIITYLRQGNHRRILNLTSILNLYNVHSFYVITFKRWIYRMSSAFWNYNIPDAQISLAHCIFDFWSSLSWLNRMSLWMCSKKKTHIQLDWIDEIILYHFYSKPEIELKHFFFGNTTTLSNY